MHLCVHGAAAMFRLFKRRCGHCPFPLCFALLTFALFLCLSLCLYPSLFLSRFRERDRLINKTTSPSLFHRSTVRRNWSVAISDILSSKQPRDLGDPEMFPSTVCFSFLFTYSRLFFAFLLHLGFFFYCLVFNCFTSRFIFVFQLSYSQHIYILQPCIPTLFHSF